MYTIGYDIGSSSAKASLLEVESGACIAWAGYPDEELPITSTAPGWAEQPPESWWECVKIVTKKLLASSVIKPADIKAIGIAYQMHGLVVVDKHQNVLRPSIIWCDSRAVEIGKSAFDSLGREKCLSHLLNSPGNFTASKLRWVKENEPGIFAQIHKMMLPGDYIAMKLSGAINTTTAGLSEGILWNFKTGQIANFLLTHYEISPEFIPNVVPVFGEQGILTASAAQELGLAAGTKISYRAGDQPNNALSVNVLEPGEIAATAGTSGVVYGVSDVIKFDPASRVNTFAHVNHSQMKNRLGILLCINGTGIANSWINKLLSRHGFSYQEMNDLAATTAIGSDGLLVLPFGNGAERMFGNKDIRAHFSNLNFNIHNDAHLLRAIQEGIAFSFKYGMDIMAELDIQPSVIRAGLANMFLSPLFRQALADISGVTIELYNSDGSQGAARGAAIGAGLYSSTADAFAGLKLQKTVEPQSANRDAYQNAYVSWLTRLNKELDYAK